MEGYRDAHQWKEATGVAGQVAKSMPNDHSIQLMYAGQLADTGQVDQGIALAKAQLTAAMGSPDERDAHLALATIYTRLKRWQEASTELNTAEALAKKPDEKLYVYFLRGSLYDRQKLYDDAEAQFRKALAIDPQNPTVLHYLGYMLADRGVRLPSALALTR